MADIGWKNALDEGLVGDGSTDDSAALDTLANTTLAGGGTILFPPGTYKLGADVTINGPTGTLTLKLMAGATLEPDASKTLTLGQTITIDAADQQIIFDGAGTVTWKTYGRVYTNWWGANGAGEFGARFNAAAAGAVNARIYATRGKQNVTTSLNATTLDVDENNKAKFAILDFAESYINFDIDDQPFLDLTGARHLSIRDLNADGTDAENTASVGVLLSRDNSAESSDFHVIERVRLVGGFSIAALFNHGSEVGVVRNVRLTNTGSGYCVVYTDYNNFGAASSYKTVLGATATTMADSLIERSTFLLQDGATGACTVLLSGVQGLTGDRWHLVAGESQDAHIIFNAASSPNRNNRSIRLIGLHCEGGGSGPPDRNVKLVGDAQISTIELDFQNAPDSIDYHVLFQNTKNVRDVTIHQGTERIGVELDLSSNDCDFTDIKWDIRRFKANTGAHEPRLLTGQISVESFSNLTMGTSGYFSGIIRSRDTGATEREIHRSQFSFNRRTNATIASDAITMTSGFMVLTPQSGSSDDLISITLPGWATGNIPDGLEIELTTGASSHRIRVKEDASGNIEVPGGASVFIRDYSALRLRYTTATSKWSVVQPVALSGSATWDPPSLAAGATTTTTVTAGGAELGMRVQVSFAADLQGLQLTGYVSAADTVTAVLTNPTGAAINLGSAGLRVWAQW
jgi:hypothetical protein